MTKSELIKALSVEAGVTATLTKDLLNALPVVISAELQATGKADIPGIVSLKVEHKEARPGRNPATGAAMTIPARNAVKAKAAKALTDLVN